MSELIPLDYLKQFSEGFMTDTCIITRPLERADIQEGRWNDEAGEYHLGTGKPTEVYRGKCYFYAKAIQGAPVPEGGDIIVRSQAYLSIPFDAPIEVLPEDEILITDSLDLSLVGQIFYVNVADQGTYDVSREIAITREKQGND